MNTWVRHWQLLALFWLCALLVLNAEPVKAQNVDPATAIKELEEIVKPSLKAAADYGMEVGSKLVGIQAFYAIVARLIKLGD